MLAGLLFAVHEADDRPDRLAATLPFGGVTLIEYQARLLIAADATQIIVVVSRPTPELLGALSRIGRRGIAVDTVRSAVEAAEKIHPLARLLVLADGLITSAAIIATLAGEGGDALLVVPEAEASAAFERVGGHLSWAGVARVDPRRITEVAELPRDYDFQSTLVRVASQARASHVPLPAGAIHSGHGIEYHADALESRGRAMLATIVSDRRGWFDRFVLAPIARWTLPALLTRTVAPGFVGVSGGLLGSAGLVALGVGATTIGLVVALLGAIVLGLGATLADLRDESRLARTQVTAAALLPAPAVLLLGFHESTLTNDGAARTTALALVAAGALAARITPPHARRLWWGSPIGYLLIATLFTIARLPAAGLGVTAAYAFATLAAAIETLRQQP